MKKKNFLKNHIEKFLENFVFFSDFHIGLLERNYPELFKAGIFLVGLSLAGLSTTFLDMVKMDYESQSLKYQIETQESKALKDIDCRSIAKNQEVCMRAKFEESSNFQMIVIGSWLIAGFLIIGYLCLVLALIGWILKTKTEYKEYKLQQLSLGNRHENSDNSAFKINRVNPSAQEGKK